VCSVSCRPVAGETPDCQSSSSATTSPTQTTPPSAHMDPRAAWTACPRAFSRGSPTPTSSGSPRHRNEPLHPGRPGWQAPHRGMVQFAAAMPRRNGPRPLHAQRLTPQARRNGILRSHFSGSSAAKPGTSSGRGFDLCRSSVPLAMVAPCPCSDRCGTRVQQPRDHDGLKHARNQASMATARCSSGFAGHDPVRGEESR
jgi:hypothetical protein